MLQTTPTFVHVTITHFSPLSPNGATARRWRWPTRMTADGDEGWRSRKTNERALFFPNYRAVRSFSCSATVIKRSVIPVVVIARRIVEFGVGKTVQCAPLHRGTVIHDRSQKISHRKEVRQTVGLENALWSVKLCTRVEVRDRSFWHNRRRTAARVSRDGRRRVTPFSNERDEGRFTAEFGASAGSGQVLRRFRRSNISSPWGGPLLDYREGGGSTGGNRCE